MDVALGQELSSAGQRNQCIQIWYVLFTQDLLTGSYFSQAGGITTVVMEKFDAEGALDAIAKHRITHGQFVPVMFTRMLKLPEDVRLSYDVSSLERVMHAAAPCPVDIKKQMIDWWGRSSTSITPRPRRSGRR